MRSRFSQRSQNCTGLRVEACTRNIELLKRVASRQFAMGNGIWPHL